MTKITLDNWETRECSPGRRGKKSEWTLPELREYCRDHNLRVSGNKGELCNRVRNHIRLQKSSTTSKQQQCVTITCSGQRCVRYCKGMNVRCAQHKKQCRQMVADYHAVCDKIWNRRCKSKRDALQIGNLSSQCMQMRAYHALNCCDGFVDRPHAGAILKMKRLMRECNRRRYQK